VIGQADKVPTGVEVMIGFQGLLRLDGDAGSAGNLVRSTVASASLCKGAALPPPGEKDLSSDAPGDAVEADGLGKVSSSGVLVMLRDSKGQVGGLCWAT